MTSRTKSILSTSDSLGFSATQPLISTSCKSRDSISPALSVICRSNNHLGLTQLRHDDLESLVYVIVYLVKGRLPWQGIAVLPSQVHHDEVLKLKQVTTAKTLCEGLSQPFIMFIHHIRALSFEDRPDYPYLHSLLAQCILLLNQTPPTTRTKPLFVTGQ